MFSILMETILELGLFGMQALFRLRPHLQRQIQNFTGSYLIFTRDDQISVPVIFENGVMRLPASPRLWTRAVSRFRGESRPLLPDMKTHAKLEFKNGRTMLTYLKGYVLDGKRDFLLGVVSNQVKPHGNLNYIFRFGFIINHLLLYLTGKLP
jgi:hypothetical protein